MSGHGSAGQDEKGESKTEEPSAGIVSQQKSRSVALPWQRRFQSEFLSWRTTVGRKKAVENVQHAFPSTRSWETSS